MKKLLTLLAVLLTALHASAYDFAVNGIYYNRLSDGKSVEVIKKPGSTYSYSGDVNIPSTVTYSGKTYSVTRIGDFAFHYGIGLTSVVIPNSVTSIGENAFYHCDDLTSVVIPNSVTEIGDWAFWGCSGLTFVAFSNSVTKIGHAVFAGCKGLTSVKIPNSVTVIDFGAFGGCSGLTSVKIGNSVTSIRGEAFAGCSSLTSVEISNSVTEIEAGAFWGCSSMTSFSGKFSSEDHRCIIMDGVLNTFAPAGLTTYVIPNSVASIGGGAFGGCSGLTSVEIPNSVTSIGENAFDGCSGLTSVVIPNSVIEIGISAFQNCEGLTSVKIGNSVTEIGNHAFADCKVLKEITSLNTTPPTAYSDSFSSVSKSECVLKVPNESVDDYQFADGWKEFYNIVGLTDEELGVLVGVERPTASDAADGQAYDLSGNRVGEGYKGIVIRDGRKVLMK